MSIIHFVRIDRFFRFYPSSFVSSDSEATALESAPDLPAEACALTLEDVYVAAFPYSSDEAGDLHFQAGEVRTYADSLAQKQGQSLVKKHRITSLNNELVRLPVHQIITHTYSYYFRS